MQLEAQRRTATEAEASHLEGIRQIEQELQRVSRELALAKESAASAATSAAAGYETSSSRLRDEIEQLEQVVAVERVCSATAAAAAEGYLQHIKKLDKSAAAAAEGYTLRITHLEKAVAAAEAEQFTAATSHMSHAARLQQVQHLERMINADKQRTRLLQDQLQLLQQEHKAEQIAATSEVLDLKTRLELSERRQVCACCHRVFQRVLPSEPSSTLVLRMPPQPQPSPPRHLRMLAQWLQQWKQAGPCWSSSDSGNSVDLQTPLDELVRNGDRTANSVDADRTAKEEDDAMHAVKQVQHAVEPRVGKFLFITHGYEQAFSDSLNGLKAQMLLLSRTANVAAGEKQAERERDAEAGTDRSEAQPVAAAAREQRTTSEVVMLEEEIALERTQPWIYMQGSGCNQSFTSTSLSPLVNATSSSARALENSAWQTRRQVDDGETADIGHSSKRANAGGGVGAGWSVRLLEELEGYKGGLQ